MASSDFRIVRISGLKLQQSTVDDVDRLAERAHRSRIGQIAYLIEVALVGESAKRERLPQPRVASRRLAKS